MTIDVDLLRADTPGCDGVVHLNNAGASLVPRPVLDTVLDHLRLESTLGGYEAEAHAAAALDDARAAIAELLGVDPLDVALAQNDTGAWTKALWGLEGSGWFDRGGRVLVDAGIYNSHYLSLLQLRDRHGVTLETLASTEDGALDLADLDRRLDDDVVMVTATHVGTHRGLVNPVAEVGARTRSTGVPFFLDACQSTGQLPVDLAAIGCDVATGTGRKFLRGPRGTGWLFVRPEWAERMRPPGIDGSSADWTGPDTYELATRARRFEEFETSIAARLGFGTAVRYALDLGIDALAARIDALAEGLRDELRRSGARVHDGGRHRSGIVTFTVPELEPSTVQRGLAAHRINVSVTTASFARLDMESRGVPAAVRASPHAYNTVDEVSRLVETLSGLRNHPGDAENR